MKWSLKLKVLAGVTTLIIIVAGVLSAAHTSRQQVMLTRDLERLTQALAHNLAFNSEYGVLVGDRHALQDLVDGILQETDVVYAGVLDRDRRVLANGERQQASAVVAEFMATAASPEETHVAYVGRGSQRLCVVQHPIVLMRRQRWTDEGMLFAIPPAARTSEVIGMVIIGVSMTSLTAYVHDVQRTTLFLTAVIVLGAWGFSYVLVSLLTNPLRQLERAAQQVAAGHFDVRLPKRTSDEIGDLTQAFGGMVVEVRESRRRIEEDTQQLQMTARDLASLNQEMEDLLRVVSHDLRAPLINIQGFAKRLEPLMSQMTHMLEELAPQQTDAAMRARVDTLRQALQPKFAESLRFISKGIEKMDTLLASLLAISRVGRKADPLRPQDLDGIVDDVLATFAHQLQERTIQVIRHPLPTQVPCRRNELNQVVSNLLANAIAYMGPTDRRCIEIGGSTTPETATCTIKDTGIGIALDDQERIFQMFTRLQAVDTPGEGIGLAYVKKILRAHGGTITVTSARGQGSTFTVTLPLVPVQRER